MTGMEKICLAPLRNFQIDPIDGVDAVKRSLPIVFANDIELVEWQTDWERRIVAPIKDLKFSALTFALTLQTDLERPFDRIRDDLYYVLIAFRIFKRTSLSAPIILLEGDHWSNYSPEVHVPLFVDEKEASFSIADLKQVAALSKTILKIYKQEDFSRLHNAINYYEYAFRNYLRPASRLVDAVTALESIFTTDGNEISKTISLRLAWFIGKDDSDRKEIYSNTREIYDLRSKIIHGQAIPRRIMRKTEQERVNLQKSAELYLQRTLHKILTSKELIKTMDNEKTAELYFADELLRD